jgi:neutral ceramidase
MQNRRQFMQAVLAMAACGPFPAGATTAGAPLRAGAGRAEISFPAALYPLEGFVAQHDPLHARVLLLDSGGQRIALAVIDITSMSAALVAAMKQVLTRVAQVPAEQAILCASHTFSAPHVSPAGTDMAHGDAVLACYTSALAAAAAQAAGAMRPGTLGYGEGVSRIGVNRDVPTPAGWWLGSNAGGHSDPAIGVLRIDGPDGAPLAILLNAAVQPSVMDGSQRAAGGRLVTADLAGAAVRHIEQHFDGATVALFLIGAAGDQAPLFQANRHVVRDDGSVTRVDAHEAGWSEMDRLGAALGGAAVGVAGGIKTSPSALVALRRDSVQLDARVYASRTPPTGPVATLAYEPDGKAALPFVLLQLGEMMLVGVQPELSAIVGARIKAASPYRHTIVATMVDGAAKYLPDLQAYQRYTYEARSSPYAPGAAEAAERAIVARMKQMKQEHTRD